MSGQQLWKWLSIKFVKMYR